MAINSNSIQVAYFSMEIALHADMPTYSGGLGILAGDTLRAAADLGVPMAAVTLLHRNGYFRQSLDELGNQKTSPEDWQPEKLLTPMNAQGTVEIEGRKVHIRAWRYEIDGIWGHIIPVYLLDTNLPENSPEDQQLTHHLYGGDSRYRLCQEAVLGLGGMEMLRMLGHHEIRRYHMNEGHSALLILDLIEQQMQKQDSARDIDESIETIRGACVFTTHTPVPAGHDKYTRLLPHQVLGDKRAELLEATRCCEKGTLNMTLLALKCSQYVNGVAMRHGEISKGMYPGYPIRAITNGVHAATWTSPPFQELFDQQIPEWRYDNLYLRYSIGISLAEISRAHARAKHLLLEMVRQRTGVTLSENVMTIGFARRATAYKRADLLFTDLERLQWIAQKVQPFQLIFGGKAHPEDEGGKETIRRLFDYAKILKDTVPVVYIENYDMEWAMRLCAGCDLWLNTPQRPNEASGTSGMKAAMNGVPSFSVLDGWWVEGHVEGQTGWSIGHGGEFHEDTASEATSLYDKLEQVILPLYYGHPLDYAAIMRSAIALNGSFFNTQRMLMQYVTNAYFPKIASNFE